MEAAIEIALAGLKAIANGIRNMIMASQLDEAKKQAYLDQLDASIAGKEAKLDSLEVLPPR